MGVSDGRRCFAPIFESFSGFGVQRTTPRRENRGGTRPERSTESLRKDNGDVQTYRWAAVVLPVCANVRRRPSCRGLVWSPIRRLPEKDVVGKKNKQYVKHGPTSSRVSMFDSRAAASPINAQNLLKPAQVMVCSLQASSPTDLHLHMPGVVQRMDQGMSREGCSGLIALCVAGMSQFAPSASEH